MQCESLIGNKLVRDVRHLLVEHPAVVKATDSLETLLQTMIEDPRTRHVYITDEQGILLGSVRMNSVVHLLFAFTSILEFGSDILLGTSPRFGIETAGDIMNTLPCYVTEDTHLSDAVRILMREKINELPVVDENKRLIGQISTAEIIAGYLRERRAEQNSSTPNTASAGLA